MVSRIPFGCVLDMMSSSKLLLLATDMFSSSGGSGSGSSSLPDGMFASLLRSALSWRIRRARSWSLADCRTGDGDTVVGWLLRAMYCQLVHLFFGRFVSVVMTVPSIFQQLAKPTCRKCTACVRRKNIDVM